MNAPFPDKSSLRAMMIERRLAQTAEERELASRSVCMKLAALLEVRAARCVAGYWPVNGEVDVRSLLDVLHTTGKTVALPVVVAKHEPLQFRRYKPGVPMQVNAYGIPEPKGPVVVPDVLLVPLVAFDDQNHRLGYGGGFYDRTLTMLRKASQVKAIGVAYALQQVETMPVDDHDQPLDMVVAGRRPAIVV